MPSAVRCNGLRMGNDDSKRHLGQFRWQRAPRLLSSRQYCPMTPPASTDPTQISPSPPFVRTTVAESIQRRPWKAPAGTTDAKRLYGGGPIEATNHRHAESSMGVNPPTCREGTRRSRGWVCFAGRVLYERASYRRQHNRTQLVQGALTHRPAGLLCQCNASKS